MGALVDQPMGFPEGPVPYPEQLHFSTPLDRQLGELADSRLDIKFFLGILRGKLVEQTKKVSTPFFFLKETKIEGLPKIRLAGRICCFFWKILVFTSCVEKLLSKVYQDWC